MQVHGSCHCGQVTFTSGKARTHRGLSLSGLSGHVGWALSQHRVVERIGFCLTEWRTDFYYKTGDSGNSRGWPFVIVADHIYDPRAATKRPSLGPWPADRRSRRGRRFRAEVPGLCDSRLWVGDFSSLWDNETVSVSAEVAVDIVFGGAPMPCVRVWRWRGRHSVELRSMLRQTALVAPYRRRHSAVLTTDERQVLEESLDIMLWTLQDQQHCFAPGGGGGREFIKRLINSSNPSSTSTNITHRHQPPASYYRDQCDDCRNDRMPWSTNLTCWDNSLNC